MAYIAKTAFEARITNNEFEDLANIAGRYQEGSPAADAVCSAGILCVRNGQLPCEGFTGVYNENTWKMNAATSSTNANSVVYACNTHDVNIIADGINGAKYAMGTNTLGLPAQAGRNCTFTKISFDGESVYRFGEGNISGTVGQKTYFTITTSGQLAPASSAPTNNGDLYFELRGTGNFVEGTSNSFGYYDLVACRVVA